MLTDLLSSPLRRGLGIAAAAGCLLVTGCAQMSDMTSGMGSKSETSQIAGLSGAALDTAFVTRAMQSDMLEIAASRLALTRTTNPQIHRFARQMVDDHTMNGSELSELASRLGMASTPPAPLAADEAKLRQLQAANDGQFETLYVQMIAVEAHTEAVALFRREAAQGGNAELRAFAGRKVPTLEHHLTMGKALASAMR
jgi:putative membrane protein